MSPDERRQTEKDTLWEIHEQKQVVACLEKKLSDHFEAAGQIRDAWQEKRLRFENGQLVEPTVERIKEHAAACRKLEDLEMFFQRLIGAGGHSGRYSLRNRFSSHLYAQRIGPHIRLIGSSSYVPVSFLFVYMN